MSTPRISLRRSAFRAWLAGQEITAEVGLRGRACHCPLARFLKAQGAPRPFVDCEGYTADGPDQRTPRWAGTFLRKIDCAQGLVGLSPVVTAAEALAVLESIGP